MMKFEDMTLTAQLLTPLERNDEPSGYMIEGHENTGTMLTACTEYDEFVGVGDPQEYTVTQTFGRWEQVGDDPDECRLATSTEPKEGYDPITVAENSW